MHLDAKVGSRDETGAAEREPLVWIVSADHWPRALLRAELIERGVAAAGFEMLGDALAVLYARARPAPRTAVIDVHGQRLSRARLELLTRRGTLLIAFGSRREVEEPSVAALPWAQILARPTTIGALADAAQRLAGAEPRGGPLGAGGRSPE